MNLPTIPEVLADSTASYWLKDALRSALKRDIVDAANDAQVLAEVLADRCTDLTCPKDSNDNLR
jgi:hypothetical protein